MTADRQEFWNEIWFGPIEAHPDPDQLLIENTRSLTRKVAGYWFAA